MQEDFKKFIEKVIGPASILESHDAAVGNKQKKHLTDSCNAFEAYQLLVSRNISTLEKFLEFIHNQCIQGLTNKQETIKDGVRNFDHMLEFMLPAENQTPVLAAIYKRYGDIVKFSKGSGSNQEEISRNKQKKIEKFVNLQIKKLCSIINFFANIVAYYYGATGKYEFKIVSNGIKKTLEILFCRREFTLTKATIDSALNAGKSDVKSQLDLEKSERRTDYQWLILLLKKFAEEESGALQKKILDKEAKIGDKGWMKAIGFKESLLMHLKEIHEGVKVCVVKFIVSSDAVNSYFVKALDTLMSYQFKAKSLDLSMINYKLILETLLNITNRHTKDQNKEYVTRLTEWCVKYQIPRPKAYVNGFGQQVDCLVESTYFDFDTNEENQCFRSGAAPHHALQTALSSGTEEMHEMLMRMFISSDRNLMDNMRHIHAACTTLLYLVNDYRGPKSEANAPALLTTRVFTCFYSHPDCAYELALAIRQMTLSSYKKETDAEGNVQAACKVKQADVDMLLPLFIYLILNKRDNSSPVIFATAIGEKLAEGLTVQKALCDLLIHPSQKSYIPQCARLVLQNRRTHFKRLENRRQGIKGDADANDGNTIDVQDNRLVISQGVKEFIWRFLGYKKPDSAIGPDDLSLHLGALSLKSVPKEFRCAITGRIMSKPVKLSSDVYCDKESLEFWRISNKTNPRTREMLNDSSEADGAADCELLEGRIVDYINCSKPVAKEPALKEPEPDEPSLQKKVRREKTFEQRLHDVNFDFTTLPRQFICPLTGSMMKDPVCYHNTSDFYRDFLEGVFYEHSALKEALNITGNKDPMTNVHVNPENIIVASDLLNEMNRFVLQREKEYAQACSLFGSSSVGGAVGSSCRNVAPSNFC